MRELQNLQNIKIICHRIRQECTAAEINNIKHSYCSVLREIHEKEKNQPAHVYQYGFDLFSKETNQRNVTLLARALREKKATQAEFYGVTLAMYHLISVLIHWDSSHSFWGIRMKLGMPVSNNRKEHIAWAINNEIVKLLGFNNPHDWMIWEKEADKSAETCSALPIYDVGKGVPQGQGNAEAQIARGREREIYRDYVEAAQWYRQAAEQGNAEAQHNLGAIYYRGNREEGSSSNPNGVAQDYAEAVKWFQKSADQGYADAQYYLGLMYVAGYGVAKDRSEAEKWFGKAAEQGYWLDTPQDLLDKM